MIRNHRSGVEDLWQKTIYDEEQKPHKVPSARYGRGRRWRARYVDDTGQERSRAFDRKSDAQAGSTSAPQN